MSRHVMQFSPRGQPGAMPYSPQRDLAMLYVPAMREAIAGLDQVNWKPYFQDWMKACRITEPDLAEGIRCFVEAHRLFTGDETIKEPDEALEKAGFFKCLAPVRSAIYHRLGEVITAGFFIAIRDVTIQGEVPPNNDEIARMVVAGRNMAERLHGKKPEPIDTEADLPTIDSLKIQIEDLESRNRALQNRLERTYKSLQQQKADFEDCQRNVTSYALELGDLKKRGLWDTLLGWWQWRDLRRRDY